MSGNKDPKSSSDTGAPVIEKSITGLGAASAYAQGTPLAIGAGMNLGEAHISSGHELTHMVHQVKGHN